MNLQEKILKSYNEQYPSDTLRDISEKTGIQLTRIFRIFNGYEMKIKEYEKSDFLVDQSLNYSHRRFYQLAKHCIDRLSTTKLIELENELGMALATKQFLRKQAMPLFLIENQQR